MRFKKHCVNVTFQMIDGDEGLVKLGGQNLAVGYSYQKRTYEPGPLSHADGIDVSKIEGCLEKGLTNDWNDLPQVLPRGQFGDDTAILAVNIEL
jgi:hypothetical protein